MTCGKSKKIRNTLAENDPVDHPAHYTRNGVELIDIIDSLPYCRGAAIKYIYRAGIKDPGKELEGLRKARWMIEREIARTEKKP